MCVCVCEFEISLSEKFKSLGLMFNLQFKFITSKTLRAYHNKIVRNLIDGGYGCLMFRPSASFMNDLKILDNSRSLFSSSSSSSFSNLKKKNIVHACRTCSTLSTFKHL